MSEKLHAELERLKIPGSFKSKDRKTDEVSAWNTSARQTLKALASTLPGLQLDVEEKARVIASVAACGEDNYVEYETRQVAEGAKRCLVHPTKPWADLEFRCSFITKHQRRRDNFSGFKAIYQTEVSLQSPSQSEPHNRSKVTSRRRRTFSCPRLLQ